MARVGTHTHFTPVARDLVAIAPPRYAGVAARPAHALRGRMGWRWAGVSAIAAVLHGLVRVHLTPGGQRTVAVPPTRGADQVAGGVGARGRAMRGRGTRRPTRPTVRSVRRQIDLAAVGKAAVAVRPPRAAVDSADRIRAGCRAMPSCRASLTAGRTMRRVRRQIGLAPVGRVAVAIAHRPGARQLADRVQALLLARARLRAFSTMVAVAGEVRLAPVRGVAVTVAPPRVTRKLTDSGDARCRGMCRGGTSVAASAAVVSVRGRPYLAPIAHVIVAIVPAGVTRNHAAGADAIGRAVVAHAGVATGSAVVHRRGRVGLASGRRVFVAIPSPRSAR